MTARRFGVLHRSLVLPVLIVMGGLQVMMRCSLILRGGLKMVTILAAMVSAGMLRLVAHDCVPGGVSSLKARPLRAPFTSRNNGAEAPHPSRTPQNDCQLILSP